MWDAAWPIPLQVPRQGTHLLQGRPVSLLTRQTNPLHTSDTRRCKLSIIEQGIPHSGSISFYPLPHLNFSPIVNCQTFLISKSNLGGRVGKIFFIRTQGEDRTKNYFSHLPNINFEKMYIYCQTLLIKYQFDPQRKSISLISMFLVRAQRRSYWPGRS